MLFPGIGLYQCVFSKHQETFLKGEVTICAPNHLNQTSSFSLRVVALVPKKLRLSEKALAQESVKKKQSHLFDKGAYTPRTTKKGFRQHHYFGSDPSYYGLD